MTEQTIFPTEYNKAHTRDFEELIKKYILPFSHEKAEELMDHIYKIYAEIGYPPLLSKGSKYFPPRVVPDSAKSDE